MTARTPHQQAIAAIDRPLDALDLFDGRVNALYAVRQSNGPRVWQLHRPEAGWNASNEDSNDPWVGLCCVNAPKTADDARQWLAEGRMVYAGDGPVSVSTLMTKLMIGRVVGLYQPRADGDDARDTAWPVAMEPTPQDLDIWPPGLDGVCEAMAEYRPGRQLTISLTDGSGRAATRDELAGYLACNPHTYA